MRDSRDLTASEVAEAVSNASSEIDSKEFQMTGEKREVLSARLKLLLELDKSIGPTAKAWDIFTKHQRTYCSSRILTDVRPIFTGENPEVSGSVIVHTLALTHHENGEHQEFL